MRTIDELVLEVEDNVEQYYEDIEIEKEEVARLAVEDVLYNINLPDTAIDRYWDRLIDVAAQKYEKLTEFDRF